MAEFCSLSSETIWNDEALLAIANVPSQPAPVASGFMDIDAVTSYARIRGPLSPEERQHRVSSNLCIVCGSATHLRDACPRSRYNRPVASPNPGFQQG